MSRAAVVVRSPWFAVSHTELTDRCNFRLSFAFTAQLIVQIAQFPTRQRHQTYVNALISEFTGGPDRPIFLAHKEQFEPSTSALTPQQPPTAALAKNKLSKLISGDCRSPVRHSARAQCPPPDARRSGIRPLYSPELCTLGFKYSTAAFTQSKQSYDN